MSTGAYTVNALNQYATVSGVAVRHDLNGNLTGDGVWTYTYDPDNRMKTANRSGTSAALAYDPEGRLVKTTVNGVDTVLLYDGQNLAAEYGSAGTVTRRYVFGPGIDEPLVQYEGAGTASKSWLYANHQGSVVAQANGSGATTGSQAYGAFGETAGTPASRFGYTGQQYLAPLGLYYYKARMYSPALGRFLQTDPVGYQDDMNWYAYVGNNPVNLADPGGLAAWSAQAFNNSTLGSAAAFEFSRAGFSNDPGYKVAAGPLLPLLVFGLAANEIANSDVPMIGGMIGKVGASAAKETSSIWSATKSKSAVENAFGHWEKHAAEFPELANSKQYVEAARSLASNPPSGALIKSRGVDTLIYDKATNTFLVKGADGAPRTMFRPTDGINYWNKQ